MSNEEYERARTEVSDLCEDYMLQTPTENNTAYFLQRIDGDLKAIAYYLKKISENTDK